MTFTFAALATAAGITLFARLLLSGREQFFVPFLIVCVVAAFLWSGFVSSLLGALPTIDDKIDLKTIAGSNTGVKNVNTDETEKTVNRIKIKAN